MSAIKLSKQMSAYYPDATCGGNLTIPLYSCNPCPDYEYGRIGEGGFIKSSYIDTVLASPTSTAVWTTGINNGDIIVMNKLSGTYDGGTTTEIPGFGRVETANGGKTHIAVCRDPNYKENGDFYNAARTNTAYTFFYCTSDSVHFSETECTIDAKNPVQDDVKSVVVWEFTVKWSNGDSPIPYDKPANIFDRCYIPA